VAQSRRSRNDPATDAAGRDCAADHGVQRYNDPSFKLGLTARRLAEQQVYDLTTNFLRTACDGAGRAGPLPYGGKVRTIVVDIDPKKLFAWGISPWT